MAYMSFAYLLQTERATFETFEHRLGKFQDKGERYIDTLFATGYFVQGPATAQDWFPQMAWERINVVPYSFRAAQMLASVGYNAEAYILLRHVLEVFVQLRYFAANPRLYASHLQAATARDRVSFKTMFEAFSPGYYAQFYSLASGVAHAGVPLTIISGMGLNHAGQSLDAPLGNEFNEKKASMVINQWMMLMYGFLAQIPNWAPGYQAKVAAGDPSVEQRRLAAIVELEEWRTGHRATIPHSHEWIDKSSLLIGVP